MLDYDEISYLYITLFMIVEDCNGISLGSSLITLHLSDVFPLKPLLIILSSPLLYVKESHIAESREIPFDCNVSPDTDRIHLLRYLLYLKFFRSKILNEIVLLMTNVHTTSKRNSSSDLFRLIST
jgi:hypothetical protein